jgi:hypothetical protein
VLAVATAGTSAVLKAVQLQNPAIPWRVRVGVGPAAGAVAVVVAVVVTARPVIVAGTGIPLVVGVESTRSVVVAVGVRSGIITVVAGGE